MRKEVKILGAVALVVIIGAVIGANFYRSSVQNERITSNSNSNKGNVNAETLVRPDSPTMGPADAPVTLVEFLDPECESCAAFAPAVKKIMKDYDGKIRLVVRYMPLHPNSLSAATFTEAAGEQGKYWQAQDMLFQKQPEWGTKHGPNAGPPADINALFKKYSTLTPRSLKTLETQGFLGYTGVAYHYTTRWGSSRDVAAAAPGPAAAGPRP